MCVCVCVCVVCVQHSRCWLELEVDREMVRLCALLLRLMFSPDAELGRDDVE